MPIYEVPLPNGTILEIEGEAGREREAQARARQYFQQAFPQEFEEWRRTQVGFGRSLVQGASRAIDEFQGQLYSAAEGFGQSLNMPSLQNFGREGRIRNAIEAEAAQPEALRTDILSARGVGDVGRAAAEIVTGSLPQTGTALGGALTGARLGAAFGVPGAVIGGLLGGAAAGFLPTAGSNIQRQVQVEAERRGVPEAEITQIPSPGAAFAAAVPQAALESGADVLTLGAARFLGRPVREAAGSLGQRVARGAGVGAATEAVVEPLQTGIERYQADLPVNPLTSSEAAREYLQAGLGGAIAGGVLGGAARGAFGARPTTTQAEVAPQVAAAETNIAVAPAEENSFRQPAPAPEAEVAPTPPATAPVAEAAPQAAPEAEAAPAPAPITGFVTERGTYQVNEQGLTSRVETTPEGQQVTTPPATALYISPENARVVQAATEQGFDYRVVSMTPEGPREVTPGQAIASPDNFILLTNNEGQVESVIQPQSEPAVGLVPLELQANEQGEVVRTLGDPITEIQQASSEAAPVQEPVQEAPTVEAAPTPETAAPQVTPEQEQEMWRGYSLNAGPEARSPVVEAARQQTTGQGRPAFTREQFGEFVRQAPQSTIAEGVTETPPSQAGAPETGGEAIQNFTTGRTPDNPETGARAVNNTLKDQVGFMGKIVSPISMLPFWRPALKPASESLRSTMIYENLSINDGMRSLDSYMGLPNRESKRRVLQAWADASSSQNTNNPRAPNTDGFTQQEIKALDDLIGGGQRALDYEIESRVISYYDSSLTKNADRASQIDAMWQQYPGRRLWQIPTNVLESVSPEGFDQIQKLNAIRNPYYMPQIADGSHFIAVYKKDASGKITGSPVRMQAYFPLNEIQRRRNFEDPETRIIEDFEAAFPNRDEYYIMPRGVEFTANEEARKVRGNADAVSEYLTKLQELTDIKNSAEARRTLNTMVDQLRKASMDRLLRPNQNILQAVNSRTIDTYVENIMPRYYAAAAKMQARNFTADGWAEATKNLSRNDKAYLNNHRDYATTPTEAYGGLRSLTYMWLMGGAPDSAFINSTQIVTTTAPIMFRDSGRRGLKYLSEGVGLVLKHSGKTFKADTSFIDNFEKEFSNPVEKAYVRRAYQEGVFDSIYTIESRGNITPDSARKLGIKNADAVANAANKTVRFLGSMQQSVEQMARAATFVGAMRAARANPRAIQRANQLDGRNINTASPDAAFQYAVNMVQNTHYVTNKYDRPYFMRFTPGAEVATQFMNFPFKTMELFTRQAISVFRGIAKQDLDVARAGIVGFLTASGTLVALGGIWALPGADFLKELTERLIQIGWGTTQNFDADLRSLTRDYLGDQGAEGLVRGLPQAYGGASLSRRFMVDPLPFGDILSFNALALFGPTASIPEGFWRGIQAAKRGDYFDAAVAISPRALGNVLKGIDLEFGSGEIRSTRGNVLINAEDVKAAEQRQLLGIPFSVRQAFGIQPSEIASRREWLTRQEEIERQNRDKIQGTTLELARYLVQAERLREQGRASEAQNVYNDLEKRLQEIALENDKHIANGRDDLVINITRTALMNRARTELYGATSEEASARAGSRVTRPAIQREREMYTWRERQ